MRAGAAQAAPVTLLNSNARLSAGDERMQSPAHRGRRKHWRQAGVEFSSGATPAVISPSRPGRLSPI
jgi:hypothetical protein